MHWDIVESLSVIFKSAIIVTLKEVWTINVRHIQHFSRQKALVAAKISSLEEMCLIVAGSQGSTFWPDKYYLYSKSNSMLCLA